MVAKSHYLFSELMQKLSIRRGSLKLVHRGITNASLIPECREVDPRQESWISIFIIKSESTPTSELRDRANGISLLLDKV